MSFAANPFVVVLDANVLFPVRIRDVLLTFAQEGMFRARLTDQIMDEWSRNLIRLRPELEASVRRQDALIREHFEECFVEGYEPLIEGLNLPDTNDRHVLAAAIRSSAQVIVTENHRDFPPERLAPYDIETLGADDMLANTYALFRQGGARALRKVRQRYDNPPMTASEFLLDLTKSGLSKLAALARQDIEYI